MTSLNKERERVIQMAIKTLSRYMTEKIVEMYLIECSTQEFPYKHEAIGVEQLRTAPAKLDDSKAEVQDDLREVNLGTTEDPPVTYVGTKLEASEFEKITTVLKQYRDCFSWDYSEMPTLDRRLVEHQLPTKDDYFPFQQPP